MFIYAIEWEKPANGKPESIRINDLSELESTIKLLEATYGDKIVKFSIA